MTGDRERIPAIEQISRRMKLVADVAIQSTPGKKPGWKAKRERIEIGSSIRERAMELSEGGGIKGAIEQKQR